jgi:hypothetical protein
MKRIWASRKSVRIEGVILSGDAGRRPTAATMRGASRKDAVQGFEGVDTVLPGRGDIAVDNDHEFGQG